jgi:hypothetical protein
VKLDRATVCLPIKDRLISHAFYTAHGHMWQVSRADGFLTR